MNPKNYKQPRPSPPRHLHTREKQKPELPYLCNQDDIKPDHELLQWEKWAKERNKQTEALGAATQRPPTDLAMNLIEKVREKKEEKIVLEHAQMKKKLPTFRGAPYDPPVRLKPNDEIPHELTKTRAEMGKPPIIEHIKVPEYVQATEKGLTGVPSRPTCEKLNADYKKYKELRERQLEDKIRKIDPYKANIDNLIVVGGKPKPPVKKPPILPRFTITEPQCPHGEPISDIYALRINNTVIFREQPNKDISNILKMKSDIWNETCTSWTYYFNVPSKKAGRAKITIQNLGTVSIRYCWVPIKKIIPYISEEKQEQVFYFNKNEDVVSPGQTKDILFTFLASRLGNYEEHWEISPCNATFETKFQNLTVNLYGDSTENIHQVCKQINKIKREIHQNVIARLVRDFIIECANKAVPAEAEKYPYKKMLLEEDLFLMKNPVCYYHQTHMGFMSEYYKEMTNGQTWDLSIRTWRNTMMRIANYDERMRCYGFLRESHRILLRPVYEPYDVAAEKHRAVLMLFGDLADLFEFEYDRQAQILELHKEAGRPQVGFSIIEFQSDSLLANELRFSFYIRMYEHVADFIEKLAGTVSSIDLNRWIDFDFCRRY